MTQSDNHLPDVPDRLEDRQVDAVDPAHRDVVGSVDLLEAVEHGQVGVLAVERRHNAHAVDVLG